MWSCFSRKNPRDSTSTPIGFEVRSDDRWDDDSEPLARSEPIEVDLGNGITFRIAGRIDRIDKVGTGDLRGSGL